MKFSLCAPCIPVEENVQASRLKSSMHSNKQLLKILNYAISVDNYAYVSSLLAEAKYRKLKVPNNLLKEALDYNQLKMTEVMIEQGLDPNYSQGALLYFAAELGKHEFIRVYLRAEVDPDSHNGEALVRAVNVSKLNCLSSYDAHVKTVNLLLSYFANPNVQQGKPLYLAAKYGHCEIIEALCNAGADVTMNNNQALKVAASNNHHKAVITLLFYGADFSSLTDEQQEKYEYLNDIKMKHENDEHKVSGLVHGGMFFAWKSKKEEMCEYLSELEERYRLYYICHARLAYAG